MKGKKAVSDFPILNGLHFVLGAVVTVLLFTLGWVGWSLFNPEKAEASTTKSMDDIIIKLSKIEKDKPVIAYGDVNEDAAIVGFSSGQMKAGEFNRPDKCGARSNSCICSFKGDDGVLECKGFSSSTVSTIASGDGGQFIIKGAKSFSLEMTLSGNTLTMKELT